MTEREAEKAGELVGFAGYRPGQITPADMKWPEEAALIEAWQRGYDRGYRNRRVGVTQF